MGGGGGGGLIMESLELDQAVCSEVSLITSSCSVDYMRDMGHRGDVLNRLDAYIRHISYKQRLAVSYCV